MNRRRSNLVAPRGSAPLRRQQFGSFSLQELWRKDFLSGLGLWVVIEIVSFLLLPALGAIEPGERLKAWFSLSIPLGIGGAFLLAVSSRYIAGTNEQSNGSKPSSLIGQSGGWLGMIGILFPFLMVTGEFLGKALGG